MKYPDQIKKNSQFIPELNTEMIPVSTVHKIIEEALEEYYEEHLKDTLEKSNNLLKTAAEQYLDQLKDISKND